MLIRPEPSRTPKERDRDLRAPPTARPGNPKIESSISRSTPPPHHPLKISSKNSRNFSDAFLSRNRCEVAPRAQNALTGLLRAFLRFRVSGSGPLSARFRLRPCPPPRPPGLVLENYGVGINPAVQVCLSKSQLRAETKNGKFVGLHQSVDCAHVAGSGTRRPHAPS